METSRKGIFARPRGILTRKEVRERGRKGGEKLDSLSRLEANKVQMNYTENSSLKNSGAPKPLNPKLNSSCMVYCLYSHGKIGGIGGVGRGSGVEFLVYAFIWGVQATVDLSLSLSLFD